MPPLIRTPAELERLLPRLEAASVIALDTEFHGERTYLPQPMLLQLRPDAQDAWLVDAHQGPPLAALGPVLAGKHLVVHGGASDLEILGRLTGVVPADVFDTQIAAAFCGFGWPVRLPDLTEALLGLRLAKTETVSDWSRRPLTEEQVRYAELDVLVLADLERELIARVAPALRPALAACTAELLRRASGPEPPDELWHHIGGSWLLGGRERAALRRLARWRDQVARARNVPRYSIIGDAHLLDLSRRRPETPGELRNNRRLPSAFARSFGPEVLAEIAASNDDVAPPPRLAAPRAVLDVLAAAARVIEAETGVAAELVLPNTVLSELWAGGTLDAWRMAVVGPRLDDYMSGRVAIAFPGRWISIPAERSKGQELAFDTE